MTTPCGHTFHKLCLNRWYSTNNDTNDTNDTTTPPPCPLCRSPLLSESDLMEEELVRLRDESHLLLRRGRCARSRAHETRARAKALRRNAALSLARRGTLPLHFLHAEVEALREYSEAQTQLLRIWTRAFVIRQTVQRDWSRLREYHQTTAMVSVILELTQYLDVLFEMGY